MAKREFNPVKTEKSKAVTTGVSISIDTFNNSTNSYILPGFLDVHVHLREPGFLYKETVETGSMSAAAGGFTHIYSMPNLKPCPDSPENLQVQLDAIERNAQEGSQGAAITIRPYGAITVGEGGRAMADLEGIADKVVGFTDDGVGVMSDELMEEAMVRAKKLGKIVVAHCEDTAYPKNSSEAEYKQLERDLELVRKTGCSYHVCHISTKESVELVRAAKAEGLDVTCETAMHYLVLNRDNVNKAIAEDPMPGRFKMNPPIKFEEDRLALLEAIEDGTIDMLATDHAPHSMEEKSKNFEDCAFGIVGLETAFPVAYTELVLKKVITLEKLVELMSANPAKRFGEEINAEENYSIWDLEEEYTLNPEEFKTKGRATPFEGWKVKGRCLKTVAGGKEVYSYGK